MAKIKICSKCAAEFGCGSDGPEGGCWCNKYPPLFTPDPVVNCMCPKCLHEATVEKINNYVAGMTVEKALNDNKAKDLACNKQLVEGIDYYIENSYYVFTAWYHLRRGYCCKNRCRHCPYGYKKQTV